MGTLSFTVTEYAPSRGQGPVLRDSKVITSGAHTSSTSASFVEDASGDITVDRGKVFIAHADEAMRVAFGGTAATASTGHYIPATQSIEIEVSETGKVSIIDVA